MYKPQYDDKGVLKVRFGLGRCKPTPLLGLTSLPTVTSRDNLHSPPTSVTALTPQAKAR